MTSQPAGESGSSQKVTKGEVTNYGKLFDVTKEPPTESDLNGYITWRIDVYFRYCDVALMSGSACLGLA